MSRASGISLILLILMIATDAGSQTIHRLTDVANANLVAAAALGTLTPGTASTPSTVDIQFRLRSRSDTGYRLDAQALFIPALAAPVDGGSTISASDLGVGIVSILPAAGPLVDLPRADAVDAGFDYDPASIPAPNGLTPFGGAMAGQATLADLAASTRILSGNRIANNANIGPNNFLTVTMRFATVPQYFTPASFSATVLLTIGSP